MLEGFNLYYATEIRGLLCTCVYTYRQKYKIDKSRNIPLKEEMNVLGLKDSDIFQIQMVWYDPNKDDKRKK